MSESNTLFNTENPLITAAMGESISPQDQQVVKDFNYSTPQDFIQKYGTDAYNYLANQADALNTNAYTSAAAHNRTWEQAAGDWAKNFGAGAASSAAGTGAFISGIFGADQVSAALANAAQNIQEMAQNNMSIAGQSQQQLYAMKNAATKNRINREYLEDLANGVPETTAQLRREGKGFWGDISNTLSTPGQFSNVASNAAGSFAFDVAASGGIGVGKAAVLKGAEKVLGKKAVASAAEKTSDYLAKHAVQKKIADAMPWMTANALEEGGDAYSSLLTEGMDIPVEELVAKSPEFNQRVKEYVQQGKSIPEAQQLAKQDLIKRASMEAGIKTGALAVATSYFTKGLQRPFERLPEKSFAKWALEGTSEGLIDEPMNEGSSTYFQNVAKKQHLDPSQDVWEDVGSSAAQGSLGGFGIAGIRGSIGAVPGLGKNIQGQLDKAWNNRPMTTYEISQWMQHPVSNETMDKEIWDEDIPKFTSVQDNVLALAKEIKNREKDPKTNKEIPLTSERKTEIQQELKDEKEKLSSLGGTKNGEALIKRQDKIINELSNELLTEQKAEIKKQRRFYTEDIQLSEEQKENEENYLQSLALTKGESTAKDEYNSLPEKIKSQVDFSLIPASSREQEQKSSTPGQESVIPNNSGTTPGLTPIADLSTLNEETTQTEEIPTRLKPEQSTTKQSVDKTPTIKSKEVSSPPVTTATTSIQVRTPSTEAVSSLQTSQTAQTRTPSTEAVSTPQATQTAQTRTPSTEAVSTPQAIQSSSSSVKTESTPPTIVNAKSPQTKTAKTSQKENTPVSQTNEIASGSQKEQTKNVTKPAQSSLHVKKVKTADNRPAYGFQLADNTPIFVSRATDNEARQETNKQTALETEANIQEISKNKNTKFVSSEVPINLGALTGENKPGIAGLISTKASNKATHLLVGETNGQNRQLHKLTPDEQKYWGKAQKGTKADQNNAAMDIINSVFTRIYQPGGIKIKFQQGNSIVLGNVAEDGRVFIPRVNEKGETIGTQLELQLTPEVTRRVFDEEGTDDEAVQLITEAIENHIAEVQAAYDLNPQTLAKNNQWLDQDDGQIKELATEEVKQKFNKTFGDLFSNLVTPVARPYYLWQNEDPLNNYYDALIKGTLLDLAQKNHLTNRRVLNNILYKTTSGEIQPKVVKPGLTSLDLQDRPINQLIAMLNPKGDFQQQFSKAFLEQIKNSKNFPETFKKIFFSDGTNPDKRFIAVAQIAAVHYLSILSAYPHEINTDEITQNGLDISLQNENNLNFFNTSVIEQGAYQHLVSGLRRILGVAQNNKASQKEFDEFFGTLAVTISNALTDTGIIERTKHDLLRTDGKSTQSVWTVGLKYEPDPDHPEARGFNDYDHLFRPRADIVLALIDPALKNKWSIEPSEAGYTALHSNRPLTRSQRRSLEVLNHQPLKINMPYVRVLLKLAKTMKLDKAGNSYDSQEGLSELLFGSVVDEGTRKYYSARDYKSKIGKNISNRLAFDFINEIMTVFSPEELNSTNFYFNYAALKNGRYMQLGSGTQQGNKLLRQIGIASNGRAIDIVNTESKDYKKWAWTIASQLGGTTNKNEANETKAAEAINAIENRLQQWLKDGAYTNFLNTLAGQEPDEGTYSSDQFRDDFNKFKEIFNNNFKEKYDLNIDGDITGENLNALIELARTANLRNNLSSDTEDISKNAQKELSSFNSAVLIEIDGIADGPTNINMMYAMPMGSFTPRVIRNASRGGIYYGVQMQSQHVTGKDASAKSFFGTEGKDLHAEVAENEAIKNICSRFIEAQKILAAPDKLDNASAKEAAENQIEATKQFFNILDKLGFVTYKDKDFNWNDLKTLPDNDHLPFKLDREISKMFTTVVPYIAGVTGATVQVRDYILAEFYNKITQYCQKTALEGLKIDKEIKRLEKKVKEDREKKLPRSKEDQENLKNLKKKLNTPSKDALELNELLDQVVNFISWNYDKSTGIYTPNGIDKNNIKKYKEFLLKNIGITNFTPKIYKDLIDPALRVSGDNKLYYPGKYKESSVLDFRNLELTDAGKNSFERNMEAIFGEPAWYAVNNVIGTQGMKGARVVALSGWCLGILAQGAEEIAKVEAGGSLGNLSGAKRHAVQGQIDSLSPSFLLPSGSQAIVRKTDHIIGNDVIYNSDPEKEDSPKYYSSVSSLKEVGVSTGALLTQALGDASMVTYAMPLLQEAGLNCMQIYDGLYTDAWGLSQNFGTKLNEAYNSVYKQKVFNTIYNKYQRVGKRLKELGYTKETDSILAIQDCLANLAEGKMLNGQKRPDGYDDFVKKGLLKEFHQFQTSLEDINFIASLQAQHQPSKNSGGAYRPAISSIKRRSDLNQMFHTTIHRNLEQLRINEHIQHQILDAFPKTIHHMSGSDQTYSEGKLLTYEEAQEVFKHVNDLLPENKRFNSWDELISAYQNRLCTEYTAANEKVLANMFGPEAIKDWKEFTGRDTSGTSGFTEITDQEIFDYLQEKIPLIEPSKVQHQKKSSSNYAHKDYKLDKARDLTMNWIQTNIKNPTLQKLYREMYKRILKLAPDNLEIHFVNSINNIPEEFQSQFNSSKGQIGLFTHKKYTSTVKYADGAEKTYTTYFPHIYILDTENSFLNEKGNKAIATLMHELVHASVSDKIVDYYSANKQKNLSQAQILAFENLEKLLDTFMDSNMWNTQKDEAIPKEIERIRDILGKTKNPTQRMDEALAYILANGPLFEQYSKQYAPKSEAVKEHFGRLNNLLSKIVQAATNVVKKILNIIGGSTFEQMFSAKLFGEGSKIRREYSENQPRDINTEDMQNFPFISLFGQNTMVLLDTTKKPTSYRLRNQNQAKIATSKELRSQAAYSLKDRKGNKLPWNQLKERIKTYSERVMQEKATTLKPGKNVKEQLRKERTKAYNEELSKVTTLKNYIYKSLETDFDNAEEIAETAVFYMFRDSMDPAKRYQIHSVLNKIKDFWNNNLNSIKRELKDQGLSVKEVLNLMDKASIPLVGFDKIYPTNLDRPELINPKSINDSVLLAVATHTDFFNSILSEITKKVREASKEDQKKFVKEHNNFFKNITEGLLDPLEKAQEWASAIENDLENKLIKDNSIRETVKVITEEQAEAAATAKERQEGIINSFFSWTDKGLSKIAETIAKLIASLPGFDPSIRLELAGQAQNLSRMREMPLMSYNFAAENVRRFANKHIKSARVATLVKELYGRTTKSTPFETMLKEYKGYFNKLNFQNLEELPKHLNKLFKKTKVTKKIRNFLYSTLVTTHVSALSFDEFTAIFYSPLVSNETSWSNEINNQISDIEDYLKKEYPDRVERYKYKVQQLVNYITGRAEAGPNLLTNAVAIAQLLGEHLVPLKFSDELAINLNKLITLYSLRSLDPDTVEQIQKIYSDDSDAIDALFNHLQSLDTREQKKVVQFGDRLYLNNYLVGNLQKSHYDSSSYILVPKSQVKAYISLGYKELGDYPKSEVNPNEKMVQMYCAIPLEDSYQEGILQCTRKTAFTWKVDAKTRGETQGTRIYDRKTINNIMTESLTNTNNYYIPIYDETGKVIGYDRAIPKDQRHLLNKNNDLFQSIAKAYSRQEKEFNADVANEEALKLIQQDYYDSDEKARKEEFIDLFESDDPDIIEGLNRLTPAFKEAVKEAFDGDHFYLRSDVVNLMLGHQNMSITDMWKHRFLFPNKVEDAIIKCLEAIFGPRVRYWLGRLESLEISWASWARDTIIIRSGFVAVANVLSNLVLLNCATGMPFSRMYQFFKDTIRETEQYNKLAKQQRELTYKLNETLYTARKEELRKEIKDIKDTIEQMSIYPLIKEGEYSTISTEGLQLDDVNIWKGNIDNWLQEKIDLFNDSTKNIGKEILMTKSSTTYKTMREFVSLGDWVAKVATYRYLTEDLKYLPDSARQVASALFVDFDQPVEREREYVNRTGLTWFFTYKIRMIPAAIMCLYLNPSRVLFGTILESVLPFGLGTPFNENIFAKLFTGDLGYSVGLSNMLKGITLHPLSMLFAWAF